jgi:predicted metal-dependent phosphoesterase TrpH
MNADLHCHSTASDGELSPRELYAQATDAGVELLALTDHDTVAGFVELRAALRLEPAGSCRLISGVELSTAWNKCNVHVVGLDIDETAEPMQQALARQSQIRFSRARMIADKLGRAGISGAFDGALALARGAPPCRPHFAAWLVQHGVCQSSGQAFDRYLSNQKMAGINHHWPALEEAVAWIADAGGVAVLAHPENYNLTRAKLRRLSADFAAAGGRGIELAARGKTPAVAASIEQLCREYGLAASIGSDYHGAHMSWKRLGCTPSIPADIIPVWDLFQ